MVSRHIRIGIPQYANSAMCIGIPMRVKRVDGLLAECEGRGRVESVSLVLVGDVAAGQWVLVALGIARDVLDEQQAAQINAGLDALEAVQAGVTDLDCHFADLLDRQPAVPAGLAPARD
jgi:hydrogenase expression/formation protein HypC